MRKTLLLLAGIIAVAACEQAAAPGDRQAIVAPETSRAASQGRAVGLNEAFAELADRIPGGFAGMYYGEAGEFIVALTDLEQASPAVDALMARQSARVPEHRRISRSQIRVVQAQYDWSQLYRWFRALYPVFAMDAFVRADIDEVANRIVIGMESPASVQRAKQMAIDVGVPISALSLSVAKRARPLFGNAETTVVSDLGDYQRPVAGGFRVGTSRPQVCTLGFNVKNSAAGWGFVSNSHCSQVSFSDDNTTWGQPTTGTPIGSEDTDPPLDPDLGDEFAYGDVACPEGKECRRSDAALMAYDDSLDADFGRIAKTTGDNGSKTLVADSAFFVIVEDDPACPFSSICTYTNKVLEKVGHATGWTSGQVSQTCVLENPGNEDDPDARFLCQDWVAANAAGGDSGAPVFEIINDGVTPNEVALYGILWGGEENDEYVFSRVKFIEDELGTFQAQCLGCGGFQ